MTPGGTVTTPKQFTAPPVLPATEDLPHEAYVMEHTVRIDYKKRKIYIDLHGFCSGSQKRIMNDHDKAELFGRRFFTDATSPDFEQSRASKKRA